MNLAGSSAEPVQWAAHVVRAFSLGTITGRATELSGGRAHSVWRLETSSGTYVAKALNPYHTGNAKGVALIRDKIRLELAARTRGVHMPSPVASISGDFMVRLPGPAGGIRWWRVHEWVAGEHPGWDATSPENARWVGRTLAVIHEFATARVGKTPAAPLVPMDRWQRLAERAQAVGADWAPSLTARLETIAAVSSYARELFAQDGVLLYSHAECDQRNVIMSDDGQPCLLDWDSLIYVSPMAELFAAAMNWAGANTGHLDLGIAAQVVAAYRLSGRGGGRLTDSAGYWLAWQLGWLWYSAQRSLGDNVAPVDLRDRPAEDITVKLNLLPQWLSDVERWGAELSSIAA